MPAQVLNKHGLDPTKYHGVYVGRPSIWGNPFVIGKDGTREEVVAKYETYLLSDPGLMSALWILKGRNLVCWCAPLPCHADILLKYANREDDDE